MEGQKTGIIYLMVATMIAVAAIGILPSKPDRPATTLKACGDVPLDDAIVSDPAPESCTIFTASYGDTVLFGNNEDWINPNTYYWAVPPKDGHYGAVYFGFDNFWPQGGINEKGLAYDVNALPKSPITPHPELPKINYPFYENLKKYATVEEVIDAVKSHSWEKAWRAQLHVADSSGDAVVISAGPDGQIVFTRKQKGNGHLISTNFNRANPKNGRYPCWRYDTAVALLEKIQDEDDLTADSFRFILDSVHQEGPSVNTVYSNTFDLKHGIIYLYHWHQFGEFVKLNVAEEIYKTTSPTRIKDLFSQKTVAQALKEYLTYRKKITAWKNVLWAWSIIAAGSVAILIWRFTHKTRVIWPLRMVWVLIVAFFGPLGLMSYSFFWQLHSPNIQAAAAKWKCAFGDTMFGVVGHSIGIALAFSTFYLIQSYSESSPLSIVLRVYGLPLVVGLFFYQAPFMVRITGETYWNAVVRRFITEVISLNFVLVGMLPVGFILLGLCETHLGLSGPASAFFWGVIILCAFAGVITVYPFNFWMAQHGLGCLPFYSLADGETKQRANPHVLLFLRNAWGALLLSFALISGAVVLLF
jgi:hypothetical protein